MKKLFLLAFVFVQIQFATTLTGTLNAPDGTGVNGRLYLSLSQVAALLSSGGCGGPIEVVPTQQIVITVSSGAMQSPPAIYGNDCMLPQGTYYNAKLIDNNGNVLFVDRWYLTGASVDVGSIVSLVISGTLAYLGTPSVVLTAPLGSQTINQPVGTQLNINTLNVTDTFTAPNGASCTTSSCSGFDSPGLLTSNGNYTITGQWTFNQDILFGPSTDLGSANFPATNAWVSDVLITSHVKLILGNALGAPTDFYDLQTPQYNLFRIVDSNSTPVLAYDRQLGVGLEQWIHRGHFAPGTSATYDLGYNTLRYRNLYLSGAITMTGTTGADLNCGSVTNPAFGLRTDTQSLQICVSGTLYQVQLQ